MPLPKLARAHESDVLRSIMHRSSFSEAKTGVGPQLEITLPPVVKQTHIKIVLAQPYGTGWLFHYPSGLFSVFPGLGNQTLLTGWGR
jgi:hypothetical protein